MDANADRACLTNIYTTGGPCFIEKRCSRTRAAFSSGRPLIAATGGVQALADGGVLLLGRQPSEHRPLHAPVHATLVSMSNTTAL
jgi:hypothetical protein